MNIPQPWWAEYTGSFPPGVMSYVEAEYNASQVQTFDVAVIPGLFQTEAYASGIMGQYRHVNSQKIRECCVSLRLARQWHAFEREEPLKIHAVIDEAALYRTLSGQQVQYEQLLHLADLAAQPHVVIQVLSLNNSLLWTDHSLLFAIITGPNGAILSKESSFQDHVNSNNPFEIAHYQTAFADLCNKALGPEASLRMIRDIATKIQQVEES